MLAVVGGRVVAVIDWKSDVGHVGPARPEHRRQIRAYLAATGALRGVLVYLTLGIVEWVFSGPATEAPRVRPVGRPVTYQGHNGTRMRGRTFPIGCSLLWFLPRVLG